MKRQNIYTNQKIRQTMERKINKTKPSSNSISDTIVTNKHTYKQTHKEKCTIYTYQSFRPRCSDTTAAAAPHSAQIVAQSLYTGHQPATRRDSNSIADFPCARAASRGANFEFAVAAGPAVAAVVALLAAAAEQANWERNAAVWTSLERGAAVSERRPATV